MTNSPNGNFPSSGVPGMVPGTNGVPVQPGQAAQPSQSGQAAQPAQPAQPVQPAVPGHSTMPGQEMPPQAMPTQQPMPGQQQAMPGQPMSAQYSPAQAGGYGQAAKPKNKKVIIGVVSAVSVVVLAIVGVVVWLVLTATPSKEEVKQGIEQAYDEYFNIPSEVEEFAEEMGVDEDDLQNHYDKSGPQFAQCVTDKVYDRVSKETKITLSEGSVTIASVEDAKIVDDASGDCYSVLINEYASALPVPSREDYRKGMEIIYAENINTQEMVDSSVKGGMPEDKARAFWEQSGGAYAQCMTDNTYDAVSDGTKRYVAQGIIGYAAKGDMDVVSDNTILCLEKARKEFNEKNQ